MVNAFVGAVPSRTVCCIGQTAEEKDLALGKPRQ